MYERNEKMVDHADLFQIHRYPSWGILLRPELADAVEVARYGRYSQTRSHSHSMLDTK